MILQYEKQVREIICDVLGLKNCDEIAIKDDLQYIGMDSQNCIQLIIALERHFRIEIPEEKLGLKYVRNIYDICKLVKECSVNK